MSRRVLVLFAATRDPEAALMASLGPDPRIALEQLESDGPIDVVTFWTPRTPLPFTGEVLALADGRRPLTDRVLTALGLMRLRDALARYPAGRLLNSLGPADASRVFWRTLRSRPDAMALADAGTVVIAADLAATLAARRLLDRGRAHRAVWTIRAGIDAVNGSGDVG